MNRIDSLGLGGVAFGAAGSDPYRTGPTVLLRPRLLKFRWPQGFQQLQQEGVKRGSQAAGGRSVRGQQLLPVREEQNRGEEAACIVKTRCLAGPPRECDSLSGWRELAQFLSLRLSSVEEIFEVFTAQKNVLCRSTFRMRARSFCHEIVTLRPRLCGWPQPYGLESQNCLGRALRTRWLKEHRHDRDPCLIFEGPPWFLDNCGTFPTTFPILLQ